MLSLYLKNQNLQLVAIYFHNENTFWSNFSKLRLNHPKKFEVWLGTGSNTVR